MANTKFYGTGRRKKSIARVYLVPVSYTHLDVYKRQVLIRRLPMQDGRILH